MLANRAASVLVATAIVLVAGPATAAAAATPAGSAHAAHAAAAVLTAGAVQAGPAHAAQPPPPTGATEPPGPTGRPAATGLPFEPLPGTVGAHVDLTIERDGALTVVETVVVPQGDAVTRQLRLRQPVGDDLDRVFTLRGESIDNGGTVSRDGDVVTATFRPGTSTLRYTVDGVVADVGDRQEARWTVSGGWSTAVDTVSVAFAAPRPSSSVTCFAGPAGSSAACTLSQISDTQLTTAREVGLAAGERVELAVGLPAGTAPSTIAYAESFSLARAFRLTPGLALALGAVLLGLAAGLALVFRARGRDEAALAAAGAGAHAGYEPLAQDDRGRVLFASPEGVLPGQIGTVVDEHVDVVDVTATVVDLAVRNYVWLAEISGAVPDWRVVRRNPADDALRPYERAVHAALFTGPDGAPRDEVAVSALRGGIGAALPAVRDAMYADVVGSGWFQRRPDTDRTTAGRVGAGVVVAGVVLTVVLAALTTVALLGLAVVVAGAAVVVAARHLPARTALGSGLLAQLVALRAYLRAADPAAVPPADRELVFSRSLPYAVVLGETDRWLAAFADLDPGADGTPGLYWYGSADAPDGAVARDLRAFAARFPQFVIALDAALAEAGHLRALAAPTPA